MYIPNHFKIEDEKVMYDIIEANGFATLFSTHNGSPYASHLPLTLNRDKAIISGHFSRSNEQWKDIDSQEILVIFQGPHCYISPSWYETKTAVPTWNYVTVHVYGQMELITCKHELLDSLRTLTMKYEGPNSSYNLDIVDPSYIDGMSKGIIGFNININKMEGKAKLSQNHPVERQKLIIQQLEQIPDDHSKLIARTMKDSLRNK